MSDGMGRELAYLSSHATNRYFIPNWGSYVIEGKAPALIPVSGNWKMGNAFVNTDGSAAKIILGDNTWLTVTGVPGSKQELEFKFTRAQNGKPFVSYTYNLAKKVDATPDAPVTSNNE